MSEHSKSSLLTLFGIFCHLYLEFSVIFGLSDNIVKNVVPFNIPYKYSHFQNKIPDNAR